jgi:hypothetical protein
LVSSNSWESSSFSNIQEFPNILRKWKICHSVLNDPPLASIPKQSNPSHDTQLYFSKTHFNIILLNCPFPSGFPTKLMYVFFLSSRVQHAHLSHSLSLNYIRPKVQIMYFLIMKFSLSPCCVIPLRSKYSSQHSVFVSPVYVVLSMSEIFTST